MSLLNRMLTAGTEASNNYNVGSVAAHTACIHRCCLVTSLCVGYSIPYSYPTALEMVASGRVNVKPLITHTYKLEETLKAFERAKTGEGGAIKVRGVVVLFAEILLDHVTVF